MSDKVLLVTTPDDCLEEGFRIFVFNLEPDQSLILSQCLSEFKIIPTVIIYSADNISVSSWIFDKIYKSDLIIFNANSSYQNLVGYLSGKMNSYYFGDLKDLSLVNKSVIFDVHQLKEILERNFEKYGKF